MPKITTAQGPTGLGAPPAATTFTREDGVEIPVLPLCYPPGATANYVWTTDANGNGSWQPVTSDGALGALARVLFTVPGGGGTHAALANEITAVDTTSGSGIVDLPDAPAASTLNAVKQIVLGASNTVTITCQGSDVINKSGGGTTQSLTLTSQGSLLHYNGAGIWTVLSDDLPLSQLQALFAPLASPALTGTPTAPTATPGDTSTRLATDAFVAAAVTAGGVTAGAGLTKTGNTLSVTVPASPYASQTLVSPAASITFSAIPAGYNLLRLLIIGASAAAAESDRWAVQVNGDSGGHYDMETAGATVSSSAITHLAAQVQWFVGAGAPDLPGASATAGIAGMLEITIPAYAGTTFQKIGRWDSGFNDAATSVNDQFTNHGTATWRSTAAIGSVTIATVSGSNLIAGTTALLYLT